MELPKSYLDQMKRIQIIKKLKDENKSKSVNKHKNFHMEFRSNTKRFLNDEEKLNNIKSSENIFRDTKNSNFFSTTKENIETFQQTWSSSNMFQPNMSSQQNQNYATLSKTPSKTNTSSNFYKSFSGTNKGGFPFISKTNRNNYNEEDDQGLVSIYHMQVTDPNKNNIKDYLMKDEKSSLLNRYNVKSKVNIIEKQEINKVIDPVETLKHSTDFSKTMHIFSRPHGKVHNYYYEDPYKSLKNLKLNSQIHQSITQMRQEKMINAYAEEFNQEKERCMKIVQMPRVKESNSKKNKILFEKKHYGEEGRTEMSYENDEVEVEILGGTKDNKKHISRDQLLQNVEFHITFKNLKLKPKSRSQFTMTLHDNKLFLFGGMSSERMCDIWICELKGPSSAWREITFDEEDYPVPRVGHTSVRYKNELITYGGSTPHEYFKAREDLLVFNLGTCKFFDEKSFNKVLPWRRNHVGIAIGHSMMVHGGVDDKDVFLNDIHALDMQSFRWSKVSTIGIPPNPIAYHSCELVVDSDKINHPNFSIHKTPDVPLFKNKIKRIKFEGAYFFGGMDSERNYSNELRILKVGKRPCEWVYPKITGQPPHPRVNANMNFYNHLNILIIHGGRNDLLKQSVFNDIFVLDLENLIWSKCKTSYPLMERSEFRSVIHGDKLILLGGINAHKFLPMDFCEIHLDIYNSRKSMDATALQKKNPYIITVDETENNSRQETVNTVKSTSINNLIMNRAGFSSSRNVVNGFRGSSTSLDKAVRFKTVKEIIK